jgi:hypothetical protein
VKELKEMIDKVPSFRKLADCVELLPYQFITRELDMDPAIRTAYKDTEKHLLAE